MGFKTTNEVVQELETSVYVLKEAVQSLLKRVDILEQQVGLKVKVNQIEPVYSHTDTGLFCATHKASMNGHKRCDGCYVVFGNFERIWMSEEEISKLLGDNIKDKGNE